MAITINGTGTITGIAEGGLPDAKITGADLATGTVSSNAIADSAVSTAKVADGAISSTKIASGTIAANNIADDAVTSAKLADDLSLPGDTTVTQITETVTTKSASFTPNLSTEGTVFSCSGTMTITMPTAEAGKSFTIIHSSGSSITWSGTILWNGGAAPTAAAAKEVYVFLSDGTSWYGNIAGTGYA